MGHPFDPINEQYKTAEEPGGISLLANVQSLAVDPFELDEHVRIRRANATDVEHIRTITAYGHAFADYRNRTRPRSCTIHQEARSRSRPSRWRQTSTTIT